MLKRVQKLHTITAVFACQKSVLPNSMTYLFQGHSLYKLEISEKVTEKVHKR